MKRQFCLASACAAALATAWCLPAAAQVSAYVDSLAAGSDSVVPLRSFDPGTRARNRLAIVIGNSDYDAVPDLPNAVNDARAMAEFFRSQGYVVSAHDDITKREFEDVLRRVLFDTGPDTEVVLFYAGHGFQIGNENYLVPVDADLDTIYDVPFESVSLGSLVGIIGARARLTIVMLDSCRDNPFAGRQALTLIGNDLRETRTGFTSQAAPLNSMLVYSTAPGSVAFDGEGANSPFTAAFIREVTERPDELVKDVFERVRISVYEATQGRQVPWDSSTLVEPASFGLGAALSRPIAVDSHGTGSDRGLARIGEETVETDDTTEGVDAALQTVTLDAGFAREVGIGATLHQAVGDVPSLRIVSGPQHGHLMLTGPDGLSRDTVGTEIAATDLDALVLANGSLQIPAVELGADPVIEDGFTVASGDQIWAVRLRLVPETCDFQAGDHLDPDGMGITRYPNEILPDQAVAACEAAVAAQPQVGRFHYQLGRAYYALRRWDEALAQFETARDLGHIRAWHAIGNWHYNEPRFTGGLDRPVATEEVLQDYARGVVEGDPYAMYTLGWHLLNNGESDSIQIEGYDLVMRSLEVGHTFAMNAMAQLYLDEEGEYHDPERGLRYLTESAARADIYGYNALGLVYWRGRAGQAQDFQRAFDLFMQAADGGHPTAPYNLARMYRDGDAPGGADGTKAVEWFLTGLERGHAASALGAADLILSGGAPGYDAYDAAAIAARAAALTNADDAAEARELLDQLDARTLTGGLQRLMGAMGSPVEVDGGYGPATSAALTDLSPEAAAEDSAEGRLIALAALYWQRSPFRVDLY